MDVKTRLFLFAFTSNSPKRVCLGSRSTCKSLESGLTRAVPRPDNQRDGILDSADDTYPDAFWGVQLIICPLAWSPSISVRPMQIIGRQ